MKTVKNQLVSAVYKTPDMSVIDMVTRKGILVISGVSDEQILVNDGETELTAVD